jgi:galactokinase
MDQFAVGFSKKDNAIFLNCDTLYFEKVPLILNDCSLIITNTNKRRGLTDSKYNERRISFYPQETHPLPLPGQGQRI